MVVPGTDRLMFPEYAGARRDALAGGSLSATHVLAPGDKRVKPDFETRQTDGRHTETQDTADTAQRVSFEESSESELITSTIEAISLCSGLNLFKLMVKH